MALRLQRAKRRYDTEEPTINLTPLIDVVFSILIMFIAVAPLLELNDVQLAEGSDEAAPLRESGPISIHVRQDNTILLNQKVVTLAQLPDRLKLAKKQHPFEKPQIFHDKRAPFGTYQSIKNATEQAGFKQLDVVLSPERQQMRRV